MEGGSSWFPRTMVRWFSIFPTVITRASRRQNAASAALRYCSIRNSTFLLGSPVVTARNHPAAEKYATGTCRSHSS